MKIYVFAFATFIAAACSAGEPTLVRNTNSTNAGTANNERREPMTAHTTENQPPTAANSGGSSSTGRWSGGGEPVDTARFDGTITAAEKIVSSKPGDERAQKDLAQAYYDRGVALTEARQYAAALGDYRRALKADPLHEESKNWITQIETIYKSLKKDPPREGQEPKPLPLKKD